MGAGGTVTAGGAISIGVTAAGGGTDAPALAESSEPSAVGGAVGRYAHLCSGDASSSLPVAKREVKVDSGGGSSRFGLDDSFAGDFDSFDSACSRKTLALRF